MKPGATFVTIVPLVAIGFLLVHFAHPPWTLLRILGLILTIGGAATLTVARFQLGNSFTVRPEANQLVTHGIYSRFRNPIYIFSAILLAGLALYVNRPQYLLVFLVLIPVQIIRARKESQVLEDHFGDAYRQYKARTWF